MKEIKIFFGIVVLLILIAPIKVYSGSDGVEELNLPENFFKNRLLSWFNEGTQKEGVDEEIADHGGCDNQKQNCHPKNFDGAGYSGKKFTKVTKGGNYVPCFLDKDHENKGEDCVKGKNDEKPCVCYKVESYGKCNKNTACEGKSGIGKEELKRPCQCGNGMAICNNDNPYCLASTGEVFVDQNSCKSKKTIADGCDGDCEFEKKPEICKGLPCQGGKGKCVVDKNEKEEFEGECVITRGFTLCERIPGAECFKQVSQKAVRSVYENMFVEATDYNGVDYRAYNGDTVISGYPYYRFPSTSELSTISKELGENYTWNTFQDHYLKKDYDGLRRSMCGDTNRNTQCCIKVAPVSFDFFDAFFGPVDPRANWIWEKTGLAENWSKTVAFTDNWTLNNVFGENVSKMADLTTYICESSIRKPKPESQTGAEPPTVIGDLSLAVNGQKSPLLPDNTTLYEMSWMIFNHWDWESGQDVLYRVYAKDSTLGDWKNCSILAVNEGAEVKDIKLEEGSTDYGYYAFYSSNSASLDEDKCDHAVNIDEGCITYIEGYEGDLEGAYNGDYDMEHYCQKFVPEVYDGSFDIQEVDTISISGGGLW